MRCCVRQWDYTDQLSIHHCRRATDVLSCSCKLASIVLCQRQCLLMCWIAGKRQLRDLGNLLMSAVVSGLIMNDINKMKSIQDSIIELLTEQYGNEPSYDVCISLFLVSVELWMCHGGSREEFDRIHKIIWDNIQRKDIN